MYGCVNTEFETKIEPRATLFLFSYIRRLSFVVVRRSVCFLTVLHETSAELESDAFYGGPYFSAPTSATRVTSGAEFAELCGAKGYLRHSDNILGRSQWH